MDFPISLLLKGEKTFKNHPLRSHIFSSSREKKEPYSSKTTIQVLEASIETVAVAHQFSISHSFK